MNLQEVKELLELMSSGNCTKQQEDAFMEWLSSADKSEFLTVLSWWEEMLEQRNDHGNADAGLISRIEHGLNHIETPVIPFQEKKQEPQRRSFKVALAIAASLLTVLSAALFFYYTKNNAPVYHQISRSQISNDIKPGGNKAVLTLGDGTKVDLNNVHAGGVVANQAGIRIVKNKDGQLVYNVVSNKAPNTAGLYNTIQTPLGGQYQVNLPDGSRVWLNAASSLRYPVNFDGNERSVELTGEGYFEVAKNKEKPFKVQTKNQVVEVLGTHFNINSYEEEDHTKTSLLEGSVSVRSLINKKTIVLIPGQQAQLNDYTMHVKEVDVNEVASWKDGYFVFNNESAATVMRKIARWYNLEVIYENNIGNIDFAGSVARYQNVSEIIKTLELTGLVHFKLEGRKLTVIAN
ncbi:FecR family protein [Pedobacter sp.]|jgi:transmembrane sensor|uniref:FecR family protein n=1 Tax=Pedobacter sp. TaxID=1411316 RepID=UPI002C262D51|nr:FecR domain-containing protein [Pedobacter sp.]HWW38024.1 FecR domain-containing protein [Pedobacter sp.]